MSGNHTSSRIEIPECKQGKHQLSGVLWTSEHLNKIASEYIRCNSNVKGKPKLTVLPLGKQ